jgi:hypothetical protein
LGLNGESEGLLLRHEVISRFHLATVLNQTQHRYDSLVTPHRPQFQAIPMRTITILLALTFFSTLAFADKKSENKLKVKINHKFKDTESGKKYEFQFKYDTSELLQITESPEGLNGVYLKRNEVDKFKALVEKMLKFGDAVYKIKLRE